MNSVCVLIPHFNNLNGLIKSITSIGENEEVDIIVVDDGSEIIPNETVIENFFKGKGSLKIIYNYQNLGIENALNRGVEYAIKNSYKYIARLDCDDICSKDRFEIQKCFMDTNDDYGLIGSWCDAVDNTGKFLFEMKFPTDYTIIKKKMHLSCMFIHPTLFIRAEALCDVGYYRVLYKAAEDYDLCFRVMKKYKVTNLPLKLLKFEYDDSKGISSQKRRLQMNSKIRILKDNFYWGFYPVIGLVRNLALYYVPRSFLSFVKIKRGKGI